MLNSGGFSLELESSSDKIRAGIYLKNDLKYVRRNNLKKKDFHIVIVDVVLNVKVRIINVYRSFRTPNSMTPEAFFAEQLKFLKKAMCNNCYIMGDFNLDAKMSNRQDYALKAPLLLLNDFAIENKLLQIVNFFTWSRNINGVREESLLDHVYVNNHATIANVKFETPTFGDHVLIIVNVNLRAEFPVEVHQSRDWRFYSAVRIKAVTSSALLAKTVNWYNLSVQDHWSVLELVILDSVDSCAPLVDAKQNAAGRGSKIPSSIKNKLNKRKRLIHLDRMRSSSTNEPHIKILNKEISRYFHAAKANRVRGSAMGSKTNLWKVVKVARDLNLDSIPANLTLGGIQVAEKDAAESFGSYFSNKIKSNAAQAMLNRNGVYNGKCKLIVQNRNFMMNSDVEQCMADLKTKNVRDSIGSQFVCYSMLEMFF